MPAGFAAETARLLGKAARATSANRRGKAFEDLLCHLFGSIRGVRVARRNKKNPFRTEEIDVALWNEKTRSAVPFLPWLILAECKNWTSPVGSIDVSWFFQKMQSRGVQLGILFAAHGVTGDRQLVTEAQSIIARALASDRQILVLTADDVRGLRTPGGLVKLIKEKLCDLVVGATAL